MYTFTGKIRYSETDAYGFLTPEKLIDYFQDCSTFQSEDLGIGVKKLRSQGLAWIIVYWRVEIYRRDACWREACRSEFCMDTGRHKYDASRPYSCRNT